MWLDIERAIFLIYPIKRLLMAMKRMIYPLTNAPPQFCGHRDYVGLHDSLGWVQLNPMLISKVNIYIENGVTEAPWPDPAGDFETLNPSTLWYKSYMSSRHTPKFQTRGRHVGATFSDTQLTGRLGATH